MFAFAWRFSLRALSFIALFGLFSQLGPASSPALRAAVLPEDELRTSPAAATLRQVEQAAPCLGDLVFFDRDDDGRYEPADGETGINLVRVNLYADSDANGKLSGADAFLGFRVATGGGRYAFCGLADGAYLLEVDPANFQSGAILSERKTSTGNDVAGIPPDPNDGVDEDDNGAEQGGFGVVSRVIHYAGQDLLSVDFGFTPSLVLGNQVFKDLDNDGRYEPGDGEFGIDGVVLRLHRDADGSGGLSSGDPQLATAITAGGGLYRFELRAEGRYLVVIDAANFLRGGPLAGMISSSGNDVSPGVAPDPDDDVDHDDNGALAFGGLVATKPITLIAGSEPDKLQDGDGTSGNLTLDIGFINAPPPTAVRLIRLDAVADGETVSVLWETASELDVSAFNLYRTVRPGMAYVRVNPEPIPARGDAASGAAYRLTDKPAPGWYSYLLEVLAPAGASEYLGPALLDILPHGAGRLLLPYVLRGHS